MSVIAPRFADSSLINLLLWFAAAPGEYQLVPQSALYHDTIRPRCHCLPRAFWQYLLRYSLHASARALSVFQQAWPYSKSTYTEFGRTGLKVRTALSALFFLYPAQ